MKALDLTGARFGRLAVIRRAGSKLGTSTWVCLCDCGQETVARANHLRRGNTRSCGCLQIETRSAVHTKHGELLGGKFTHEYRAWGHIKSRCNNQKHPRYKDYGGRGIKVCERWAASFADFLTDMGRCPPGLTLDRRDNDGDYEPNNCRWASDSEQSSNRRSSRYLEHDGQRMTVLQWAKRLGVRHQLISSRLSRGWSVSQTLEVPPRITNRRSAHVSQG